MVHQTVCLHMCALVRNSSSTTNAMSVRNESVSTVTIQPNAVLWKMMEPQKRATTDEGGREGGEKCESVVGRCKHMCVCMYVCAVCL